MRGKLQSGRKATYDSDIMVK